MFCKKLLSFIRPLENDAYGVFEPTGVRLLLRLRLDFSHLSKNKLRHNFADILSPLCPCSLEFEDTEQHFLFGQNNVTFCTTLMNDLSYIYAAIVSLNPNDLLRVIPYGDKLIAIY